MLDYHTDETFPNLRECLEAFRDGLASYRRQKWEAAESAFNHALRCHAGDHLAKTYLKRLALMREHPPGPEWNGVWVMTGK